MSELRNEVSKTVIRGELNSLYCMSKLVVSILDAAQDNQIACDTLRSVSESIMYQAAQLYVKVSSYADEIHDTQRQSQN